LPRCRFDSMDVLVYTRYRPRYACCRVAGIVLTVLVLMGVMVSGVIGEDMWKSIVSGNYFPEFRVDQDLVLTAPPELYRYMDGAAELYLAYNIRELRVLDLIDNRDRRVLIEVYRFGSSADAYGVYTFDSSGDPVAVGREGTFSAGLLKFWQGNLFCRILMIKDFAEYRERILAAGRRIAEGAGEGEPPGMVNLLPAAGRLPHTVHYFYSRMVLNNLYYLSGEDLLRFDSGGVRAVMAGYSSRTGSRGVVLLILEYRREAVLDSALAAVRGEYFGPGTGPFGSVESGLVTEMGDGGFAGLCRVGNYLVLVFDGGSAEEVSELIGEAVRRIREAAPG